MPEGVPGTQGKERLSVWGACYLLHTCAEPYTSSTKSSAKSHTSSIKSRTSPDAHTSTSAVVSCGKQEFEWTVFRHAPHFSGYSVLAAAHSLCCQCSFLAVGNLQGCVKLLATAGSVKDHEWQAHEGKVFSLTWTVPVSPGPGCRLFSCGPEGSVVSQREVYYEVFMCVHVHKIMCVYMFCVCGFHLRTCMCRCVGVLNLMLNTTSFVSLDSPASLCLTPSIAGSIVSKFCPLVVGVMMSPPQGG